MIRKKRYTVTHIDTDTAADKRDEFSLYGAVNAEVVSNGKNLSVSPTKNKSVYNNVISFVNIVGSVIVDNVLYIFDHTTDSPNPDKIYKVTPDKTIVRITSGNYGFTNSTNLDVVGNKETDTIIKLYWADGVNQLRALNVYGTVPDGTSADIVLPVTLSMPTTTLTAGGSLKAGNIQYAYTLFNLNGSETNISPISLPLHILKTDNVGGVSGEVLNKSVSVTINPIDTDFGYIRIYSIHYQEADQSPKISLILETKITSSSINVLDDGNLFITELSVEEFTFLGGVLIIPKTIATKNNRLIAANYKSTNFDVPFSVLTDPRVYGHKLLNPAAVNFTGKEEFDYADTGVVTHTKSFGTPVSYVFADGKISSDSGNRLYDIYYVTISSGSTLIGSSNLDTLGTTYGAGTYPCLIGVGGAGPGSPTITMTVQFLLSGVPVNTVTIVNGTYNTATLNAVPDVTSIIATGSFNEIRYTATSSDPAWDGNGGLSVSYINDDQGFFVEVNVNVPVDDANYGNYTVLSVQHQSLTVNSVSRTPDSIVYLGATAKYIFNATLGLTPGNSYNTVSVLQVAGNREPITVDDVVIVIDLNDVLPPGYIFYTITSAVGSGQIHLNDGFNSFSLDIDSSSFVNLSDELTLTCVDLTGGYPIEGTFAVTIDLLTTDGSYQLVGGPIVGIKNSGGADELYSNYLIAEDHDCINIDTVEYIYQSDLTTIGYEGINFKLEFLSIPISFGAVPYYNSLKQRETYRIGIVFYNQYGQKSPVKWMCDILVPAADPKGPNNYMRLISTFIGNATDFTNVGVVSYQLAIVKREPKDVSVSSPGFLMPGAEYRWSDTNELASPSIHPYYTLKRLYSLGAVGGALQANYTLNKDFSDTGECAAPSLRKDLFFFYSGDTALGLNSINPATQIRILGTLVNAQSGGQASRKLTNIVNGSIDDTFVVNNQTPIKYDGYTAELAGYPDHLMKQGGSGVPVAGGVAEHIFSWEFDLFEAHGTVPDDNIIDLKVPSVNLERSQSGYLDGESISNSVNIKGMLDRDTPSNNMSYAAEFIDSVALKFDSTTWHRKVPASGEDYDRFTDDVDNYGILLVELLHYVPNQYGGNTYEAKKRNFYMLNGNYVSIGVTAAQIHLIGDVTISPVNINRSDGLDTKSDHYWNLYEYITTLPMETNVALPGRNDKMVEFISVLSSSIAYGTYRLVDNHKLLGAYNQQNTLVLGLPIPPVFNVQETFSNSVIASKEKYPNEVIDSWTDFLVNDTMNLVGTYGPITKLYNFRNEIFSYQNRAVCALIINPRVQVQSNDGVGVELGTGTFLYRYEYLTTTSGTKFKDSITDDGASMYYYDHVSKSINMHDGAELSTLKSIRQLLLDALTAEQTYVKSIYDISKKQAIFIFDNFSVVYDKLMEFFIRTEATHAKAVTFDNKILSVVSSKLNEHYAGSLYNELTLKYLIAPDSTMEKVFHNIEYRKSGKNTITYIRVDDKSGRIGEQSNPPIYNKFDINRLHLPRINDSIDRFRDVSILVTLLCPESAEAFFLDDMVMMYNIKG